MATLPFRLIDAFAEQPFEGNSAGVVTGAEELGDEHMQRIAREVNASETAFVYPPDDDGVRRLRWFTPACEVDFCGHATLAAAEALRRDDAAGHEAPRFDCRVGRLELVLEQWPDGLIWWLAVPPPRLERAAVGDAKVGQLLGIEADQFDPDLPPQQTDGGDLLVFVRSWHTLQDLRPDMRPLHRWCDKHRVRGVQVASRDTPAATIQVASRFFAPACGIDEDPVTGSAHGPLAAALHAGGFAPRVGDQAALNCVQGIPGGRTGLVRVLINESETGPEFRIAGRCHETIAGTIRVPGD